MIYIVVYNDGSPDKNGTRSFGMQPDWAGHGNFIGEYDAEVFCGPQPDTRRSLT